MANIQTWGLNWFNKIRNEYVTEDVTITHAEGSLTPKASVIEPGAKSYGSQLKVKTEHTLFIFNTADLTGVTIRRGVKLTRANGDVYEVIIEKETPSYPNDPNRNETVVPGKLLCS